MLRASNRPQDIALNEACRSKNVAEVEKAISDGANPLAKHTSTLGDMCPILYAALSGSVEIAQILLDKGADINQRSEFDNTIALHHAAANGHGEMVKFLVDHNCTIDHQDKLGRTALMEAAEIGDVGIVEYLLEKGAEATVTDKSGNTALSYCVDFASQSEQNFLVVSNRLIDAGDSPNVTGKYIGRTILHSACARGELDFVVRMVEEHKADVTIVDYDGQRPFDYAQNNHHTELANYISNLQGQQVQTNNPCCTIL